jgi:hypothetical protein
VEVPLYIGVAMGLAVSCQPGGTYYRCCPVLASAIASTTVVMSSGVAEAVVVDVVVVKALTLGVHALADKGFLLLTAALLGLLFFV